MRILINREGPFAKMDVSALEALEDLTLLPRCSFDKEHVRVGLQERVERVHRVDIRSLRAPELSMQSVASKTRFDSPRGGNKEDQVSPVIGVL